MAEERPLDGMRVVDFSSLVAGPWCTRLLADCGAEVIKVEPVGEGDVLRYAPPLAEGHSRVYAHFNCGKQSIAIDLKSADGISVARGLIEHADIVVENFRPGVMKRFGLDYESVSIGHEQLIYCSLSGFGQEGPLSGDAAYAPVVQALCGFEHTVMTAQAAGTTPLNVGVMIADYTAAIYAFGAIQTALIQRGRSGVGSHVDVSLMEAMMSLVAIQYAEAQSERPVASTVYQPVQARDGYLIVPLVSLRNYRALFAVIDRAEWVQDERFSSMRAIIANKAQVHDALVSWAAAQSVEQCRSALGEAGIACAPYQQPGQVLNNPHLRERGAFAELADAKGSFVVLNPPFRLSASQCEANPVVAALGADSNAILSSVLGYDDDEIERLRLAEIIA
jgi:crotonobetainyl-CoA:carnitine CoA-transferase CaiB-like acyl-CoA transferase